MKLKIKGKDNIKPKHAKKQCRRIYRNETELGLQSKRCGARASEMAKREKITENFIALKSITIKHYVCHTVYGFHSLCLPFNVTIRLI